MRVCIIIPMFNEARIARQSLETILPYSRALELPTTILVVDDGSRDATATIVKTLIEEQADDHLRIVSHPQNKGYGAALRTGIRYALDNSYDYVLFMDSDLTNHPRYLAGFYEKIQEGWDYIKATRYAQGGRVEGVPRLHRIISIVGNGIARACFRLPLSDYTNGFRAVKVELYNAFSLQEHGFAIIMEELYQVKHRARSFCDVPYTLTSRGDGDGCSHFAYTPAMMLRYLTYALKSCL